MLATFVIVPVVPDVFDRAAALGVCVVSCPLAAASLSGAVLAVDEMVGKFGYWTVWTSHDGTLVAAQ